MSPITAAIRLSIILLLPAGALAQPELPCFPVQEAPRIDGKVADRAWQSARAVEIDDAVAQLSNSIKCVYDNQRLYLSIQYPDASENRAHKSWVWTPGTPHPTLSKKREDTLVLKWNMQGESTDLSLQADYPYVADLWYWKAHRNSGSGYADDMYQVYTNEALPHSRRLISRFGKRFYLQTNGDTGEASYKPRILLKNFGNLEQPAFLHRLPSGSRGDISARGRWKNNQWNIEFSRLLVTGHEDDVQFSTDKQYHFGISRYAIDGEGFKPSLQIPEFGQGDVTQLLRLSFQQQTVSR